jgi:hypothetical protein
VVFQINKEFESDYINFKLGRYSKFSEKYKKEFPEYINPKNKIKKNILWQIINKDEDLKREIEKTYNMAEGDLDKSDIDRDGLIYSPPAKEIWDKPNKKREIYRYEEMQQ